MPIQVQLCAPAAKSAPQSFKVYCQVARGVRGGAGVTIHSGIRLHNNCGVLLSIGMQQRWPGGVIQEGESARTTKLVAAGDSIWLPALCCKASYLSLQPAGNVKTNGSNTCLRHCNLLLLSSPLMTCHSCLQCMQQPVPAFKSMLDCSPYT